MAGWKDRAEAVAGAFAVFFVGFAPAVLALLLGLAALTNEENARSLPAWVCFPVMVGTGALAVWLAGSTQRALYRCHPELQKFDEASLRGRKVVLTLGTADGPVGGRGRRRGR